MGQPGKKKAAGNMISCMIGMLIISVMLFYSVDLVSQLNVAVEKSRIERRYMLMMETEGYLTDDARSLLAGELSKMGVEGISFDGTTLSPAGYGKRVVLSVTGTLRGRRITGITGSLKFIRGGEGHAFRIYQSSTAKY